MILKKKLSDIKIKKSFAKTKPSLLKMQAVEKYYKEHGKVDENIVINSTGVLVDGYTRYLVLKNHGVTKTRQYEIVKDTYVYGKHEDGKKEYVWKAPNNIKVNVGDIIGVRTRFGYTEVIATKVKKLSKPPVKGEILPVAGVISKYRIV